MADFDNLDDFEEDVARLDRSLGDASATSRAFEARLRDVGGALGGTGRDLARLERGLSGGLRRAFDGLVLDGRTLSDTLGSVARAMAQTAYDAAVTPVTRQLGGMVAAGVDAAMGGLATYADGGAFASGRVMPFARGGVVTSPTTFPMRGGTGLMGEAGPEAIMPLARGPDGTLGVRGGGGGAVSVTMNITTPDVQGFRRSQGQVAAQAARLIGRGQRNR